jgi:signal transduction histidine kinase
VSFLGKRGVLSPANTTFNYGVGAFGLVLLAVATVPWLREPGSQESRILVPTFLVLFTCARLLRFELTLNITASLIVPLQIASVVLLGAVPTAWISLPAFLAEVVKERPFRGLSGERRTAMLGIIALNLGMEALNTLAAGACWAAVRPPGKLDTTPRELVALLVTFLVFKAVNEAIMLTGHWLRGVAVRDYVAGARGTVLIETLTLPLAALLVVIHDGLSGTSFYLFLASTGLVAALVRGLTRARAELSALVESLTQTRAELSAANTGLQRKVKEVETLFEIGRAISADIEFDRILDTIYRRCADILTANHFFIALYTEGSTRLRIAIEMIGGERQQPQDIPLGEGLTSHVILSRTPLLVRDLEAERALLPVAPLLVDDRPNRSWLGVPMVARGEVVGAIVLQEREPNAYGADDLHVLSAVASQAAISVKNARLHQEALHALRVEAENRELKRLNAKKSEFVNMVAHQFRTPLTAVIGYANLLVERVARAKDGAVPDLERHLRTVHSESRRLSDMVEELLNLSRIRSGRLPLTLQRFDVNQLASETIAAHRILAEKRRLTIESDLAGRDEAAGVGVKADSNFIRQVVGNMLSNAIKYAPEGSRILVRTRRQGSGAVLEVVDEGPGVPPDDLDRIFDEFYRAPGRTAEQPGTGLGLSICRGIVDAHGGQTWAERRGNGTAFCFTLPLDAGAEQAAAAPPRPDAA